MACFGIQNWIAWTYFYDLYVSQCGLHLQLFYRKISGFHSGSLQMWIVCVDKVAPWRCKMYCWHFREPYSFHFDNKVKRKMEIVRISIALATVCMSFHIKSTKWSTILNLAFSDCSGIWCVCVCVCACACAYVLPYIRKESMQNLRCTFEIFLKLLLLKIWNNHGNQLMDDHKFCHNFGST